jgi:GMP synthase-like glutamine amidotransferase
MTMRVLFIQHDHLSPVGLVGEGFAKRGYEVRTMSVVPPHRFEAPDVQVSFPDPLTYDAIVPMGAVWSVYDQNSIGSWIHDELTFLRAAHDGGVPVRGICFGGQALATALGGSVELAAEPEIGWTSIESDDAGLIESGPWFQFHYDRWNLPPGSVEVARTGRASQAFVLRRSLGVQFHPELTVNSLEGWNANGGAASIREYGLDPDEVVEQTRAEEPLASQRASRLVNRFLDLVATCE